MADGKSPEAKSGPVKPPVLEGTVRQSASSETAKPSTSARPPNKAATDKPAESETKKPQAAMPPPPPPVTPPVRSEAKAVSPLWPALGGGVLGLVAAYGLAWAGLWPTPPAPVVRADPRLEQLAGDVPELRTVTETTQSELATLTQRVGELEGGGVQSGGEPVDLGGIEADIAALTARIDGLGTPAADPQAAADIAAVRQDITALGTRMDEIAARVGTAEASVTSLGSSVAATSAALDAQPSDIGAVLQLPLILSGFEAAFDSGRPYESELAALRTALPDAAIPTAIANGATSGLVRPDTIATRFDAVLPAILAGRPASPSASWQDGAVDWFRSAMAIRPVGDVEGDEPEAVVARLEAAIARRDFTAAESLVQSLPQPMRAAAGTVPADITAQAEAQRFLDGLRQRALSGATS